MCEICKKTKREDKYSYYVIKHYLIVIHFTHSAMQFLSETEKNNTIYLWCNYLYCRFRFLLRVGISMYTESIRFCSNIKNTLHRKVEENLYRVFNQFFWTSQKNFFESDKNSCFICDQSGHIKLACCLHLINWM